MTQTTHSPTLQGQPGQPQTGIINPASAQGGQGESQPSMTQVDATKTAGATGTQMDQQGRSLGVDGRPAVRESQRQSEPAEDRRQGGDRRQSGDSGTSHQQQQGQPPGATQADMPDTKPSESQP